MKWFTAHPHKHNLTYLQHLRIAACYGIKLILAGAAVLVHSVFPSLFEYTASSTVDELHKVYVERGLLPKVD